MYFISPTKGKDADFYMALSHNKRELEQFVRKYDFLFKGSKIEKEKWDVSDNKKVTATKGIKFWHTVTMSESLCLTAEEYISKNKIKVLVKAKDIAKKKEIMEDKKPKSIPAQKESVSIKSVSKGNINVDKVIINTESNTITIVYSSGKTEVIVYKKIYKLTEV